MAKEKIDAVTKRPGGKPQHTSIANNLKNLQNYVGGYIETVTFSTGFGNLTVICNEEGRLRGLPHNCKIGNVDFVGDIIIVGADLDTGEFTDLPCSYSDLKLLLPRLWEE